MPVASCCIQTLAAFWVVSYIIPYIRVYMIHSIIALETASSHGVILRCCGGPTTYVFSESGSSYALKGRPKLSFHPPLNRGTVAAAIPDEMCKNCWQKIANQYLERSPSVHSWRVFCERTGDPRHSLWLELWRLLWVIWSAGGGFGGCQLCVMTTKMRRTSVGAIEVLYTTKSTLFWFQQFGTMRHQ